jgi:hypothetical protein
MAINPYRPDESAARATLERCGLDVCHVMLRAAERNVERWSQKAFEAHETASPRRRACLRAKLTTACEIRDLYLMAVRLGEVEGPCCPA